MMTPRSRARNANRYGDSNPLHQRGGSSGFRGGAAVGSHPPKINIVDSSGHPRGSSPGHYGIHSPEGIAGNASLPTSPIAPRNTRAPRGGGGAGSPKAQLPGGGGGATFYWAAKKEMFAAKVDGGSGGGGIGSGIGGAGIGASDKERKLSSSSAGR